MAPEASAKPLSFSNVSSSSVFSFPPIYDRIAYLMIPHVSQASSPIGTKAPTYLDMWTLLKLSKVITQFTASPFPGHLGPIVRHHLCLIAELNLKVALNPWLKRGLN